MPILSARSNKTLSQQLTVKKNITFQHERASLGEMNLAASVEEGASIETS